MTECIYKIFRPHEWAVLAGAGSFVGSVHDQRDGFIHLCTGPQVAGTLAKHFADEKGLIIARFNSANLENLRWEKSRGGEKFPHLYVPLTRSTLADFIDLGQTMSSLQTAALQNFIGAQ